MDLDLALRGDEPPMPTKSSTQEGKVAYEQWERSNRLSLMLIKSNVSKSIRVSIPECDKVTDFMKAVKEQFVKFDKALASTLMQKLSGMKHDNSKSVREHIMEMRDIATQLKSLVISESFLVNFILNFLPLEYEPFKISYNTHKEKWFFNELLTMCVQEEERLKFEKLKTAHLVINDHEGAKKKPMKRFADKDGCFFCNTKGHKKKECAKYKKWLEKKGVPKPQEAEGQ